MSFSGSSASRKRSWAMIRLATMSSMAVLMKTMLSLRSLRSEEHTSELQSQSNLVCRLLLEKKNNAQVRPFYAPVLTEPASTAPSSLATLGARMLHGAAALHASSTTGERHISAAHDRVVRTT